MKMPVAADGKGSDVVETAPRRNYSERIKSEEKRKRILMIVENLPVPFDRRVWSEARTLAGNGYEVSIISPKGRGATVPFEVKEGIRIYRHGMPSEGDGVLGYAAEYSSALFWEFVLSAKILFTHGWDAIHACNPPDTIFIVGAVFKYLFGKKFVFDHHDINPELYEAKFARQDFFWRLLRRLERLTFAVADISIATNESYRSIAIERGRMRPERVFVVRSGPDLKRVHSVPPDERWKSGRKFMVAYVGVIGRQEGLDLLLESAKYIYEVRQRKDVQFVIVGKGPELKAVQALCRKAGLEEIVNFVGHVDDPTLLSILSTADVCVNPDRPNALNDKSTMNKILEYMAVGKPIVQFDLTEGRISAGEASLYAKNSDCVDFGDKILELLQSRELCEQMGAVGRERIRTRLSWEHQERELLDAYATLFSKPS